jgi:hypothetical protein
MNIDSKVTYNMNAINAYNALNATTQEDNTNILLKLFLYIVLRYFI